LSGLGVSDTTSDYVVSLGISRAVSTTAMAKLEDFYFLAWVQQRLMMPLKAMCPRSASCGLAPLPTSVSPVDQTRQLLETSQLGILKICSTMHTRPSLMVIHSVLWTGGSTTIMQLTVTHGAQPKSSITSTQRNLSTHVRWDHSDPVVSLQSGIPLV